MSVTSQRNTIVTPNGHFCTFRCLQSGWAVKTRPAAGPWATCWAVFMHKEVECVQWSEGDMLTPMCGSPWRESTGFQSLRIHEVSENEFLNWKEKLTIFSGATSSQFDCISESSGTFMRMWTPKCHPGLTESESHSFPYSPTRGGGEGKNPKSSHPKSFWW